MERERERLTDLLLSGGGWSRSRSLCGRGERARRMELLYLYWAVLET